MLSGRARLGPGRGRAAEPRNHCSGAAPWQSSVQVGVRCRTSHEMGSSDRSVPWLASCYLNLCLHLGPALKAHRHLAQGHTKQSAEGVCMASQGARCFSQKSQKQDSAPWRAVERLPRVQEVRGQGSGPDKGGALPEVRASGGGGEAKAQDWT